MLWSPLTIAKPWKSQGKTALCGQVFWADLDQHLEIPGKHEL
jgi:hypothetical protein